MKSGRNQEENFFLLLSFLTTFPTALGRSET